MILEQILTYKREELERRKQETPLPELKARSEDRSPPLRFASSLRSQGVTLIAEVKKASPSKGLFSPDIDPVKLAKIYAGNGASAISVITDRKFFHGSLETLASIKAAISDRQNPIPVLRKDFIFESYQVHEAFAYGADALLLIVAVVPDPLLAELFTLTRDLGMDALVEVHNQQELERALRLQPTVVGVNNRDLVDFTVDLSTFGLLRPLIPTDIIAVSESGVRTAADVRRLASMGADAVLVGEALVTAHDIADQVRSFVRGGDLPATTHRLKEETQLR